MTSDDRPDHLTVVVGTGTEVGKTWVSAALLRAAVSEGLSVFARKPAQSFEPGRGPTDAEVLAEATGEEPTEVCPQNRWYPVAYAPPMAADVLNRPSILVGDLLDEMKAASTPVNLGLVEMAGGVASPIAHVAADSQMDLLRALVPDSVVIVADAGLGTISAVLTSVEWIVRRMADPKSPRLVVMLNRFDPSVELHQLNSAWLATRGLNVVTSVSEEPVAAGAKLLRAIWPEFQEPTTAP